MAKMRNFKFTKDDNEVQTIESSSFKKAVKSFQNQVKQKMVYVEWVSKKGNVSFYSYKLPYKTRKERKGKL